MKHTPTFLHVDINSYFATLLQQENPALRGKPVGILKEAGRTCIIAASKEAKRLGVKTGDRLKEAQQRAPELITVPAAFNRYHDATVRLKHLFESVSPDTTIFSLDEAFIDLTHCGEHLYKDPENAARQIQDQIKAELGSWVTCNVGISHNRFLAKLGSEVSPKGSVVTLNLKNQDDYLASAPFKDVCGVGFRLEKKLARLGIKNLYQIRFVPHKELEDLVGPFWSEQLERMSYGKEPHLFSLLDKNPHMKSVGRSITGYQLCRNEAAIKRILYNLIEEVIHKVQRMQLAGRYVSIKLYGETENWRAHKTLKYYISHTKPMFNLLYHQLYQSWQRRFPIIKFAVRLGMLKPQSQLTQSLLPQENRQEKLEKAKLKLNQRYGLFTLSSGLMLKHDIIRPEVTGFLGDKQYQFMEG